MNISISSQLVCCLASFVYGILAAVLYDGFQIFYLTLGIHYKFPDLKLRRVPGYIVVILLDLLYCAAVSVGFTLIVYSFFYGKVRLVFVFCGAMGFMCYRLTLGRLVMFLSEKIVSAIKRMIFCIFKILAFPFVRLAAFFLLIGRWIFSKTIARLYAKLIIKRDKARVNKIMSRRMSDIVKL